MSLKTKILAGTGLVTMSVGTAMAALPPDVSTAIGEYKTDALAAIGMVIAAGVAIWGLRKLGQKMGWF